jgi:ribose-phosphate pyrophosphokinase
MEIKKYPDGTSYISDVNHQSTWRINSYEDLWHLNQFVDAYNYKYDNAPIITIPNLIDAQADRRFNEGESSGLKLVCNFLNGMDAKFIIFHPHNPEVVEALISDSFMLDNSEFIQIIIERSSNLDNLILMSSDAGGYKPLMKLCNELEWEGETYSASKSRKFENGKSKLTQIIDRKDFGGKDILIIDDISVYGGTFKGLSKLLKERNCGNLYLAISHMTVQDLGSDPVTNYFTKVFTTNSKYNEYTYLNIDNQMERPENLEIIKLF